MGPDGELTYGSLCTGYGGLDEAVQAITGAKLLWTADIKTAAELLIAERFPEVPNLGDLRTINWAEVPRPDIVCGSWPCQPHSAAGRHLGEEDPRDLWPEFLRAIRELRPKTFFGENVARITTNGELARVARSLAEIGYVLSWTTLTASSVGAPHKRERCFVIATDSRGEAG